MKKDRLLFGAAYYPEYFTHDRGGFIVKDLEMMKAAGMNVIRIAESTWSTLEPREGEYDFTWIDCVLDAAETVGLDVIIGTPTYAVPPWLVKKDPEVMVRIKGGRRIYGHRQIFNIMNATYLQACERVIRRLAEHTAAHPRVIGFQIDNETKHYGSYDAEMQSAFVEYLKERFGSTENLNRAFGLAYWSNSIDSWEDFPDMEGCINGGLASEYDRFRRKAAADFLGWQAGLVSEYKREDQFITHNFDFDWKAFGAPVEQNGVSYGVQPGMNHYEAAKHLTLAGCDIYHYSQDHFTGAEIAFGGDSMRMLKGSLNGSPEESPKGSFKGDNYMVLETQAQGFRHFLPYPGQLRLAAYSHIASGACGVEYWNWHSIHNGYETYWKGILSHDLKPNRVYREIAEVGAEWSRIGGQLAGLRKNNQCAFIVDQHTLSAMEWFPIDKDLSYNDAVRMFYDALYELNIECDVIDLQAVLNGDVNLPDYRMVVTPVLYCLPDAGVRALREYVAGGGNLFSTFRTSVADENVTVRCASLPYGLTDVFGVTYNEATFPENVSVDGAEIGYYMELLMPVDEEVNLCAGAENGASGLNDDSRAKCVGVKGQNNDSRSECGVEILASYEHKYWGEYAARTVNKFGDGLARYLGFYPGRDMVKKYLLEAAVTAGLELPDAEFPLIVRRGTTPDGAEVTFIFNYSSDERGVDIGVYKNADADSGLQSKNCNTNNDVPAGDGNYSAYKDMLTGMVYTAGETATIEPWGLVIVKKSLHE